MAVCMLYPDTGHRAVSVMSREHLLSTLPRFPLCPQGLISNVDGLDLWEKKSRHTVVFFSSAPWLKSVLGLQPFTALEIQASFLLDVLLHSFLCL